MNILVIGCDQVGAALVRDLERIGHDISLVERDSEQLKRLDGFDDYSFGGAAPPPRTSSSRAVLRTATPWQPSARTTPST